MIQSVRYQIGHLYEDHGAWFVRFRLGIRQANGSVKMQRTAERQALKTSLPRQMLKLSEWRSCRR